jgi:hypothetical protein
MRARIVRCFVIVAALIAGASSAATAQGRPPDTSAAQKVAMQKLAYMAGDWQGDGWMIMGPGPRETFRGGEKVQSKLFGLALLVEGAFFAPDSGGAERLVHTTLGVFTWNPTEQKYSFRYWLASGWSGERDLILTDDGWYWEMPAGPGATIRYTMTLKDGAWSEIGERTTDQGKSWTKFFEMNLKKA